MAVATQRPPLASGGSGSIAMRRRCGDEAPAAAAAVVPSASKPPSSSTCAGRDTTGSLRSYKLLPKIGEGAFGVVRKALHRRTGEEVAIKSVRRGAGAGEALLREAALLAECAGNPAVVQVREVVRGGAGMDDDDLHLVMEFVGPSLHDVMGARRRAGLPFTESEARRAMRRLLGGVEKMHARGVVHCDLKPGNVLIGKEEDDGRGRAIKICDLGLARAVALPTPLPDTDTNTNQLEGTLWYMAPEQLLGDVDVGAPVDLWALGCVMAELVAGEPLFGQQDTVYEQVVKIVDVLGVPDEVSSMPLGVSTSTLSRLRDMVPEEQLSQAGFDVLCGLLEYDPKDRLAAAAALRKPWFAMEDDD